MSIQKTYSKNKEWHRHQRAKNLLKDNFSPIFQLHSPSILGRLPEGPRHPGSLRAAEGAHEQPARREDIATMGGRVPARRQKASAKAERRGRR